MSSSSGASRARLLFAYIACFVLWGSSWAVVKVGLEDLPPLRFAAVRMMLAGLVLLPFSGLRRSRPDARTAWVLMGVGVLQIALPYGLLFTAQQWIPSSWSALLFSTYAVWLLLVGRLLLPDQPLTPLKLVSAGLGLAGILALQHEHLAGLSFSGLVVAGCLLSLVATISISLANVLVRRSLAHVPTSLSVCVQTLSSSVLLLGASVIFESHLPGHWTPRAVLATVFLAVGATALTYRLLFWLLARMPLTVIGAMPLLDTLVAVLLGVVMLGERVDSSLLLGGALILSSAALANLSPAEPKKPSDATSEAPLSEPMAPSPRKAA
ncbi:DMT family transporter [Vitiosangium sp. GDMCC 1.1324]|uniref:DMT family transporter n=1 Tax=Vitiosangium sp. (strain GDMCC 1.1324) TaxID=2138576 RepID=UPI000D3AE0CF|nr:DMT family transporter [Vitiosangium sp. GDMCC 1.1324]PTL79746.1 EamA family transporter [Vitiosangium sp. GDMCC 1.1324]